MTHTQEKGKMTFTILCEEFGGVFIPRRVEVTKEWKKLQNEGIHYFYSSSNTVRGFLRIARWVPEGHGKLVQDFNRKNVEVVV
jgi:hypothetical protein